MRITKEITLKGIELAREPGLCMYTDGQGVCCVAAQILNIMGVKIPNYECAGNSKRVQPLYTDEARDFGLEGLISYEEADFLQKLQTIWDRDVLPDGRIRKADEMKESMRAYVDQYFEEKEDDGDYSEEPSE